LTIEEGKKTKSQEEEKGRNYLKKDKGRKKAGGLGKQRPD